MHIYEKVEIMIHNHIYLKSFKDLYNFKLPIMLLF